MTNNQATVDHLLIYSRQLLVHHYKFTICDKNGYVRELDT